CARLDHRLVHLGAHPLSEQRVARPALEQLAYVRVELTRPGVDDLELFLDTERELAVEETCDIRHDEPRDAFLGSQAFSMMNVGTVPAPACTLQRVVAERRDITPRTSPLKRYGSSSMNRLEKYSSPAAPTSGNIALGSAILCCTIDGSMTASRRARSHTLGS